MSEYRQDPLSRRWVIIGSDRAARPNEFVEEPVRRQPVPCPFCAGNEHETPDAVLEYRAPGNCGWLVRVVPNKYPAVTMDDAHGRPCQPPRRAVSESMGGVGRHEVIIESPRHVASLSELSPAEAELVFLAYRERIGALKAAGQHRYVQIFKNVGPAAGASLEHVHSQLVALPNVPEVVAVELASCREFYEEHRTSLLGEVIHDELAIGERIVAESANFVAWCPFASRFPYEICLAPRVAAASFEKVPTGLLGELSGLARGIVRRIESTAGPVAYNCVLHTQPFDTSANDHYHWHIEVLPRLTKVAGFEWGTGWYINPLPPEAAARQLRAAQRAAEQPH